MFGGTHLGDSWELGVVMLVVLSVWAGEGGKRGFVAVGEVTWEVVEVGGSVGSEREEGCCFLMGVSYLLFRWGGYGVGG